MPIIEFTYCNECPHAIEHKDICCYHPGTGGHALIEKETRPNILPPVWCPLEQKECMLCGEITPDINIVDDKAVCDECLEDENEEALSPNEKPWKPEGF